MLHVVIDLYLTSAWAQLAATYAVKYHYLVAIWAFAQVKLQTA